MSDDPPLVGIGTVSPDTVAPLHRWGPFVEPLDPCERLARLRCLRTIAHLAFGPRCAALLAALRRAEQNCPLQDCIDEIDRLGALDRRRLLAVYQNIDKGI